MDTDTDVGVAVVSQSAAAASSPSVSPLPHTPHRPQQPRSHSKYTPHSAPPNFAQPTVFSALPPSPPSPSPTSSPPLSAAAATRVQIESELLLPRVERRKLKKRRKEVERGKAKPAYINVYGTDARASLELKLGAAFRGDRPGLRARDVHQLIGWVMGEEESVKWAFVKNKALLVQVVLLVVDGLTRSVWSQHSQHFARLTAFIQQQQTLQTQQSVAAPPAGQPRPSAEQAGDDRKEHAETEFVQPVRVHIPSSLFSNDTAMQDWMAYHIRSVKPRDQHSSSSSVTSAAPPTSSLTSTPTSAPPASASSFSMLSPTSSPPPKRPKLEERGPAHPPALHYILTPAQLMENKYPDVKEPGFLHTCDHHRLDMSERALQVRASLAAGWHCVHTHPWGVEGEEVKAVSEDVAVELLAERMEEAEEEQDGLEDGELVEAHGGEGKGVGMEDDSSHAEPPSPPLFGIDCEMCYTEVGLELTRLTLIDSAHRILLDSFVLPRNRIVNYNTQYSGITAEMMASTTTTLEQVRHSLLLLLPSTAILVGHSLENDLRTARFVHLRCIDTAVLYPHPRGPPHKSSLRYLAKKWLNRDIQEGTQGHDSTEDAAAAMDLALEKIKRGPQWGVQPKTTELLADVLARWQRKVAVIDRAEAARKWAGQAATVMATLSDEQTTDRAVKAVMGGQQEVLIAHFTSLWNRLETEAEAEEKGGEAGEGRASRVGEACRHLDGLLASVLKASRVNSLLLLVSGQASAAHVRAMQRRRVEAAEGGGVRGDEAEAAISAAVAQLQDGVAWFAVQQ